MRLPSVRSTLAHPQSLLASIIALSVAAAPSPRQARGPLPASLSDITFWALVTTMSEPGGFFRSDNFVSNETNYQRIVGRLQQRTPPGGVYLGVGPDQNFTYIVNLHPPMAFIVDIRRQAMLQQLMYKALFEMAPTRAEFLSLLFSRHLPPALNVDAPVPELMQAVYPAAHDSVMYAATLHEIDRRLTRVHGFTLSDDDLAGIEYILGSFYDTGPDITYSGDPRASRMGRSMPGYAEMVEQTDSAGVNVGYLGSEQRYQEIRQFEAANLLVPVVGDFGGPKALRAVGDYVRDHGAQVSLIYTSNVEQYLFQSADAWRHYYDNVGTIPIDSGSLFIRAVFGMGGYGGGYGRGYGFPRGEMLITPVQRTLDAYKAGKLNGYWDVIELSR
jgi:hypothetical protein